MSYKVNVVVFLIMLVVAGILEVHDRSAVVLWLIMPLWVVFGTLFKKE